MLLGGGGNDRLRGGPGRDRITTGPGRDMIMVSPQDGISIITDFRQGLDRIKLLGNLQVNQLTIRQVQDNTLLRAGRTNLAILQNVDADRITPVDFV